MGYPLIDHILVHWSSERTHGQNNDSLSSYLVVYNVSADICDGSPFD